MLDTWVKTLYNQLVCLQQVGILNPSMLNMFQHLLGPTSINTKITGENVKQKLIYSIYLLLEKEF